MQLTHFEARAVLDGRILYLVLCRADIAYPMEEFIRAEKWDELSAFIGDKLTEMISKSEPN